MQSKPEAKICLLRLGQAEQCLQSARILLANGDVRGSVNRSYYGIFHGMRSILGLENLDFAKHAGVIGYFRKNYVKTGIFPVEVSDIIGSAFDVRNECDYQDFCEISVADGERQIQDAKVFLGEVKKYLAQKGIR